MAANHFRTFGCPVFVINKKKLQDGDSVKKKRARSWKGIYVGPSMVHASYIPYWFIISQSLMSLHNFIMFLMKDSQLLQIGQLLMKTNFMETFSIIPNGSIKKLH